MAAVLGATQYNDFLPGTYTGPCDPGYPAFQESPIAMSLENVISGSLCMTQPEHATVIERHISGLAALGLTRGHQLLAFFHETLPPNQLAALKMQRLVPGPLLKLFGQYLQEYIINSCPQPACLYDVHLKVEGPRLTVHYSACYELVDLIISWNRCRLANGQLTAGVPVGNGPSIFLQEDAACFIQATVIPVIYDGGRPIACQGVYCYVAWPPAPGSMPFFPGCAFCYGDHFVAYPDALGTTSLQLGALISAAGHGNVEALRRLMRAQFRQEEYALALQAACDADKIQCIPLLMNVLTADDASYAMLVASDALFAALHNIGILQCLLTHNADVNTGVQGARPLHAAVQTGNVEAVHVLLHFRADVDAVTPDGRTPLQIAMEMGSTALAQILLNTGRCTPPDKSNAAKLASRRPQGLQPLLDTESGSRRVSLGSSTAPPPTQAPQIYSQPTPGFEPAFSRRVVGRSLPSRPATARSPQRPPHQPQRPATAPGDQKKPADPVPGSWRPPRKANLLGLNPLAEEDPHVGLRYPSNTERDRVVLLADEALKEHSCCSIYRYYCKQYGVKCQAAVAEILCADFNLFDLTHFQPPAHVMLGVRGVLPVLEVLRVNPSLKTVSLAGMGLRNNSIEWLVHMALEHPQIMSVDVSNNPISTAGGSVLNFFVSRCPRVLHLGIDNTRLPSSLISDIGKQVMHNRQAQAFDEAPVQV